MPFLYCNYICIRCSFDKQLKAAAGSGRQELKWPKEPPKSALAGGEAANGKRNSPWSGSNCCGAKSGASGASVGHQGFWGLSRCGPSGHILALNALTDNAVAKRALDTGTGYWIRNTEYWILGSDC